MWEKFKSYFSSPTPAEDSALVSPEQDFVFPVKSIVANPQPNKAWRTNMWVMHAGKVGLIFEFKDNGAIFHEVSRDTGETVAEYFVSLDALKQATYTEIPPCRMSVSVETARKLGYAS